MPAPAESDLAALNKLLSAFTSMKVALGLVSEHLGRLQRRSGHKDLHFDVHGDFTGYSWKSFPEELIPADSPMCIEARSDCEWLPKYVESLWESYSEVEKALNELPSRLGAKLDALTERPWVASVRRNCVDLVLKWPGEVHHQTSYAAEKVLGSIPELIEKAAKRDPHPTWAEYQRLLEEYGHDVFSIRDAVLTTNDGGNGQPVESTKNRSRTVDAATEKRNAWIYGECCKLVPYDAIVFRLTKKPRTWERISTKQGIRAAAIRHAQRHSLPPIPERQE